MNFFFRTTNFFFRQIFKNRVKRQLLLNNSLLLLYNCLLFPVSLFFRGGFAFEGEQFTFEGEQFTFEENNSLLSRAICILQKTIGIVRNTIDFVINTICNSVGAIHFFLLPGSILGRSCLHEPPALEP